MSDEFPGWHGTTILSVRKGGKVVVAGDGQVSLGQTVIKANAKKVRRLGRRFGDRRVRRRHRRRLHPVRAARAKLERHPGQLLRAAVELAKDWRTDAICGGSRR